MNTSILRSGAIFGLFVLASLALSSCGGSRETREVREGPVEEAVFAAASRGADSDGFNCQSAKVALGRRASMIRFTVACARPIEGKVYFAVGRYSLTDTPIRPGYRRIGNHPRVSGPGAVRRRGACSRLGSSIACEARAHGSVIVRGGFDVRPVTRCGLGVSVRVEDRSSCGAKECNGSARVRFLADGKPQGC